MKYLILQQQLQKIGCLLLVPADDFKYNMSTPGVEQLEELSICGNPMLKPACEGL